jgi:hypothetical protein
MSLPHPIPHPHPHPTAPPTPPPPPPHVQACSKCEAAGFLVPHVLIYDHASSRDPGEGRPPAVEGRDVWWQDVVGGQAKECAVEWMDAEAPLFKVGGWVGGSV